MIRLGVWVYTAANVRQKHFAIATLMDILGDQSCKNLDVLKITVYISTVRSLLMYMYSNTIKLIMLVSLEIVEQLVVQLQFNNITPVYEVLTARFLRNGL